MMIHKGCVSKLPKVPREHLFHLFYADEMGSRMISPLRSLYRVVLLRFLLRYRPYGTFFMHVTTFPTAGKDAFHILPNLSAS